MHLHTTSKNRKLLLFGGVFLLLSLLFFSLINGVSATEVNITDSNVITNDLNNTMHNATVNNVRNVLCDDRTDNNISVINCMKVTTDKNMNCTNTALTLTNSTCKNISGLKVDSIWDIVTSVILSLIKARYDYKELLGAAGMQRFETTFYVAIVSDGMCHLGHLLERDDVPGCCVSRLYDRYVEIYKKSTYNSIVSNFKKLIPIITYTIRTCKATYNILTNWENTDDKLELIADNVANITLIGKYVKYGQDKIKQIYHGTDPKDLKLVPGDMTLSDLWNKHIYPWLFSPLTYNPYVPWK